jgi:hypothetical protein
MKKVIGVFLLTSVIGITNLSAQFSQFHAGAVFPSGNFADDDMDKIAILEQGRSGGAATGFNIGYKYYNPLSVDNLFLVIGIDIYYNGLNSDWKDDMEDQLADSDIKFPAYLNIPATVGLSYTLPLGARLSLLGEAVMGANFSKITDLAIEVEDYEAKATYDPAFGFTYGLEGGFLLNKKYSVTLRYNSLISKKYKGTFEANDESDQELKRSKALDITNLTLAPGAFASNAPEAKAAKVGNMYLPRPDMVRIFYPDGVVYYKAIKKTLKYISYSYYSSYICTK